MLPLYKQHHSLFAPFHSIWGHQRLTSPISAHRAVLELWSGHCEEPKQFLKSLQYGGVKGARAAVALADGRATHTHTHFHSTPHEYKQQKLHFYSGNSLANGSQAAGLSCVWRGGRGALLKTPPPSLGPADQAGPPYGLMMVCGNMGQGWVLHRRAH